jgi:hypothetical protein
MSTGRAGLYKQLENLSLNSKIKPHCLKHMGFYYVFTLIVLLKV